MITLNCRLPLAIQRLTAESNFVALTCFSFSLSTRRLELRFRKSNPQKHSWAEAFRDHGREHETRKTFFLLFSFRVWCLTKVGAEIEARMRICKLVFCTFCWFSCVNCEPKRERGEEKALSRVCLEVPDVLIYGHVRGNLTVLHRKGLIGRRERERLV